MNEATGLSRRQALQAAGMTATWLLVPVGARALADADETALAAWQSGLGGVPRWFDANRVHGHTRLALGRYRVDSPEFAHAAARFKALGAGAFARHVKRNNGDPWWSTAEPHCEDGRRYSDQPRDVNGVTLQPDDDVALEIIDEAHREGLKIVAYYFHMTEKTLSEGTEDDDTDCIVNARSDWVCKESDRKTPITIPNRPWLWLDITGPYREVVLTRLVELADRGADGFYFDFQHLPPQGCWGTALEDAWIANTGEPAPPQQRELAVE